jgi:hypothetical protein
VVIRNGTPVGLFRRFRPEELGARGTQDGSPDALSIPAVVRRLRRSRIVGNEAPTRGLQPATQVVNLTDRSIVVCTPDGEPLLVIVPTGYVVRVRRLLRPVGTTLIDGVSVELYSERTGAHSTMGQALCGSRRWRAQLTTCVEYAVLGFAAQVLRCASLPHHVCRGQAKEQNAGRGQTEQNQQHPNTCRRLITFRAVHSCS